MTIYDDIDKWYLLCDKLKKMKKEESELRQFIFDYFFDSDKKGNQKIEIDKGVFLEGVAKYNEKIDQPLLEENVKNLPHMYQRYVIQKKLSIKKSEYNKMPNKYKKLIDDCVTETPGLCQLKLTESD